MHKAERARSRLTVMLLVAAPLWSCGPADPALLAARETGGEGGQEHERQRLCAPECSVFCGTKEECTLSSAGEGGRADGGGGGGAGEVY